MNRPILSYSDISSSSASHSNPQNNGHGRGRGGTGSGGGRGRKDSSSGGDRGRWKKRKFRESAEHDRVHWDAQGQRNQGNVSVSYDAEIPSSDLPSTLPEVEAATVVLTDAASWDDSDLIDAWDAAMEEYHRMNGPEKDWKTEPVHKDSIWYKASEKMQWKDVVPAKPQPMPARALITDEAEMDVEEYDAPEDGAHAPDMTAHADEYRTAFDFLPAFAELSKDELFQKAVEASYWAGYWAAAYHACAETKD